MNTIATMYSDHHLRILVEEFIAMQRSEFTFKNVCSYILYRAIEEGKTASDGLYESNQMEPKNCAQTRNILETIIREGRIIVASGNNGILSDETKFEKLDKSNISTIKELMALVEKTAVPQERLLDKTFNDYLLDKIDKKKIEGNVITFDDQEDVEYFKKLADDKDLM